VSINIEIMKTIFNKTSIKLATVIFISVLLFSSCKKNNNDVTVVEGNAKFKVVNTVQGSSAQDFYQDNTKVNTSAIAYGEASDYLTVKSGSSTLFFKSTGTQTVNASANVGVSANLNYTVFYYSNGSGTGQIAGLANDDTAPAAGKARVRFINFGAALSNSVNIISNGSVIVSGLTYGSVSAYTTIDANVDLNLTVIGSTTTSAIPGASFQSGKIYSVWFDASNTTTAQYHVVTQN
jgi:hypothetical protein